MLVRLTIREEVCEAIGKNDLTDRTFPVALLKKDIIGTGAKQNTLGLRTEFYRDRETSSKTRLVLVKICVERVGRARGVERDGTRWASGWVVGIKRIKAFRASLRMADRERCNQLVFKKKGQTMVGLIANERKRIRESIEEGQCDRRDIGDGRMTEVADDGCGE
uniref:Uncharacterized protein n=1 Tax=Vespula pensylvanica TaxID=30213 RepID=A0A834N0K2_VESPE|nr:hypothetical protein H0235_017736 [Vespula pensylvanica]